MKGVYKDVVDLIGNTPIVRLNRIAPAGGAAIYAKIEFLNPGASVKDRIGVRMILDAEASGKLRPGGTIVEATSGNTGMGLALVAAARGYRCVFVMAEKISTEKVKALEAFGARVVTTPEVPPEDPRSLYSVARRIAEETPNALFMNQYENPSNPLAHERTTGPEIWDQMGADLDAVVICAGTGGTITGTGRYLKKMKPSIRVVAVDPVGSIFYGYAKTGKADPADVKPYKVEGFGEDYIPGSIDFSVIDDWVQVDDRECFLMARDLTRKEGLFAGGSGGGAVAGALKWANDHPDARTILVILPDSGARYLSKLFDDGWMRANSFLA